MKESKTVLFFRILSETFRQAVIDAKYIANSDRYKVPSKLESDLEIRVHAVEKGMSIGSVKVGFGKPKAIAILDDLQKYIAIGGRHEFVKEACSVIGKYIEFNKNLGADMSEVEIPYNAFLGRNAVEKASVGGVYQKNYKDDVVAHLEAPFKVFSQTRFSVRDFGNTPVDIEKIKSALKLCERTPSACNRQSWRVYVYRGDKKNRMFELQGGCNGFYDDMQYAILICGDQRYYNINELHQAYVDGGLYAMNLMYALHSEGVATIPLTMGHKVKQAKMIKKTMGIPEYEMPVVLIGVGSYKDNYKVAVSTRKDYSEYVKFVE